jgi:hypothetical protein
MSGGDLNASETCIIAWLPELHSSLVWPPAIADHFNAQVLKYPCLCVLMRVHVPSKEPQDIPTLYCYAREIPGGHVRTAAVTIGCIRNRANLTLEQNI